MPSFLVVCLAGLWAALPVALAQSVEFPSITVSAQELTEPLPTTTSFFVYRVVSVPPPYFFDASQSGLLRPTLTPRFGSREGFVSATHVESLAGLVNCSSGVSWDPAVPRPDPSLVTRSADPNALDNLLRWLSTSRLIPLDPSTGIWYVPPADMLYQLAKVDLYLTLSVSSLCWNRSYSDANLPSSVGIAVVVQSIPQPLTHSQSTAVLAMLAIGLVAPHPASNGIYAISAVVARNCQGLPQVLPLFLNPTGVAVGESASLRGQGGAVSVAVGAVAGLTAMHWMLAVFLWRCRGGTFLSSAYLCRFPSLSCLWVLPTLTGIAWISASLIQGSGTDWVAYLGIVGAAWCLAVCVAALLGGVMFLKDRVEEVPWDYLRHQPPNTSGATSCGDLTAHLLPESEEPPPRPQARQVMLSWLLGETRWEDKSLNTTPMIHVERLEGQHDDHEVDDEPNPTPEAAGSGPLTRSTRLWLSEYRSHWAFLFLFIDVVLCVAVGVVNALSDNGVRGCLPELIALLALFALRLGMIVLLPAVSRSRFDRVLSLLDSSLRVSSVSYELYRQLKPSTYADYALVEASRNRISSNLVDACLALTLLRCAVHGVENAYRVYRAVFAIRSDHGVGERRMREMTAKALRLHALEAGKDTPKISRAFLVAPELEAMAEFLGRAGARTSFSGGAHSSTAIFNSLRVEAVDLLLQLALASDLEAERSAFSRASLLCQDLVQQAKLEDANAGPGNRGNDGESSKATTFIRELTQRCEALKDALVIAQRVTAPSPLSQLKQLNPENGCQLELDGDEFDELDLHTTAAGQQQLIRPEPQAPLSSGLSKAEPRQHVKVHGGAEPADATSEHRVDDPPTSSVRTETTVELVGDSVTPFRSSRALFAHVTDSLSHYNVAPEQAKSDFLREQQRNRPNGKRRE